MLLQMQSDEMQRREVEEEREEEIGFMSQKGKTKDKEKEKKEKRLAACLSVLNALVIVYTCISSMLIPISMAVVKSKSVASSFVCFVCLAPTPWSKSSITRSL